MARRLNPKSSLRIISGLVLFGYVFTHLLNLGLGVISYAVLEQGRDIFIVFWRSIPGTTLLLVAFTVHLWMGLKRVFSLPTFRMPFGELLQISLGPLIPVLAVGHVVGTRISHQVLGLEDNYAWVLLATWGWVSGLKQGLLLLIPWVHGCQGLHFWLRFRPWYRAWAPWLLGIAVAVPTLSAAGFLSAGWEVQRLAADPQWIGAMFATKNWPSMETIGVIVSYADMSALTTLGALVVLLVVRYVLVRHGQSKATVRVDFGPRRSVYITPGTTVLEASRIAGVPHASVCGGRARCSTCRVRVITGAATLPEPNSDELSVLRRISAPPSVRLACQLRPLHDIQVTPLLPPHVAPHDAMTDSLYQYGREMEIAILFTDLRGFTTMTERRLPYDIVFLMNRYFHTMGETIEAHGGHLVQVFGDGIMALFGLSDGVEAGCRAALRAARAMADKLEELNAHHPLDLAEPLRMGIGIHAGSVIVGEMGYRNAVILTAVGDAVNTTSRVQEATKELGCQMVVSALAGEKSGVNFSGFPPLEMAVRGRTQSLIVHAIGTAFELPDVPLG